MHQVRYLSLQYRSSGSELTLPSLVFKFRAGGSEAEARPKVFRAGGSSAEARPKVFPMVAQEVTQEHDLSFSLSLKPRP